MEIISLSEMTLAEVRLDNPLNNKTSTECLTIYNAAGQIISDFINTKTSRVDYSIDSHMASSEVLAPVSAGLSGIYEKYLVINFAAYTELIGAVTEGDSVGNLGFDTEETLAISITSDEVVYTIPLNEDALDGTLMFEQTYPNYAFIERVDANTFKVHVELNHIAFRLLLKKEKSL